MVIEITYIFAVVSNQLYRTLIHKSKLIYLVLVPPPPHFHFLWLQLTTRHALAELLNESNKLGETAAHLAAAGGHLHVLKCLFEAGADMDAVDKVKHRLNQSFTVVHSETLIQCRVHDFYSIRRESSLLAS